MDKAPLSPFNSYRSEIDRMRSLKVLEGEQGFKPDIKNLSTRVFRSLFLNKWTIEIRLNDNDTDQIIRAKTFVENLPEFEMHYHPNLPRRSDWRCLDCYEIGPHFHIGENAKICMAMEHGSFSLISFLLFIGSFFHAKDQKFLEFESVMCKTYESHGLKLISAKKL